METSNIVLLISQLVPLIANLVMEVQKIQGINEQDKEALKKLVSDMKEKVSSITWE